MGAWHAITQDLVETVALSLVVADDQRVFPQAGALAQRCMQDLHVPLDGGRGFCGQVEVPRPDVGHVEVRMLLEELEGLSRWKEQAFRVGR